MRTPTRGSNLLRGCAGLMLALLAGCATNRPVDNAIRSQGASAAGTQKIDDGYRLRCPDAVEVTVDMRGDIPPGRRPIGADGCIDLGPLERVRVEAQTPSEAAARIAGAAGVPPAAVHVRVVDYRSQQVFIFGEVTGLQRAVPYRGPETIRDLLQRAGGITPGAEPSDVHVVRANVAGGKRPEIFPVDLRAIALNKDDKTNIRLEPFDQIFIGETRQARYVKAIPPILRPVFAALVNVEKAPGDSSTPPRATPTPSMPPTGTLARQ